MPLEKPVFSSVVDEESAKRKISSFLDGLHWGNAAISESTLFYLPYWFYSYDTYHRDGERTLHVSSGVGALNSFSNELDTKISVLARDNGLKRETEMKIQENSRVVPSRIGENEAREIIAVRTASTERVLKEEVIVSGLEFVYVPVWIMRVELGGNVFSMRVNAVNGEILNKPVVPMRDKGIMELTKEVFEELETPKGWWEYSAAVVSSASSGIASIIPVTGAKHGHDSGEKSRESFGGEDIVVVFLALVAIVVILYVTFTSR